MSRQSSLSFFFSILSIYFTTCTLIPIYSIILPPLLYIQSPLILSLFFCTHKRFKFVSYISQCLLFLLKKVANYFRRWLSIRFFSCCQILDVIMCYINVLIFNKYCLNQHFNLIPSDKHKEGKIVWIRQELLKCILQINRQ